MVSVPTLKQLFCIQFSNLNEQCLHGAINMILSECETFYSKHWAPVQKKFIITLIGFLIKPNEDWETAKYRWTLAFTEGWVFVLQGPYGFPLRWSQLKVKFCFADL